MYLAGPITGCSFDGCVNWREVFSYKLPEGITGLSPMRGKEYLEGVEEIATDYDDREVNSLNRYTHLSKVMSSSRGIFTRDFNDCRRADAIVVNLLGAEKVSVGTVMEIAWARAFDKPVIAVMEPNGNIHDHPMINECVGFKVSSLDEAVDVVTMLLLPVPHREQEQKEEEYA